MHSLIQQICLERFISLDPGILAVNKEGRNLILRAELYRCGVRKCKYIGRQIQDNYKMMRIRKGLRKH